MLAWLGGKQRLLQLAKRRHRERDTAQQEQAAGHTTLQTASGQKRGRLEPSPARTGGGGGSGGGSQPAAAAQAAPPSKQSLDLLAIAVPASWAPAAWEEEVGSPQRPAKRAQPDGMLLLPLAAAAELAAPPEAPRDERNKL